MDFFNSLTLDLKMLAVGIAGSVLLAIFSGNRKAERRYMVVLTLLAATGVYRFTQLQGDDGVQRSAAAHAAPAQPKHTPLVSTSAK